MNDDKLQVNRKRNFSAHHMLLGSAYMALKHAEAKSPGYFYSELTAITLCGLALEAIANAFGAKFVKGWADFENAPPAAKLRVVCDQLGIEYAADKEPWGTARWIIKFRNKIAHAKPELIDIDEVWSASEYDDRSQHPPKSKLEKMISTGDARSSYDATKQILLLFCDAIPLSQARGLRRDGWEGSAKHIE